MFTMSAMSISTMLWTVGDELTGWVELTGGTRWLGGDKLIGRTFNKADRGIYACVYEGKINGDIIINRTNIEQSASGKWKADICKNHSYARLDSS